MCETAEDKRVRTTMLCSQANPLIIVLMSLEVTCLSRMQMGIDMIRFCSFHSARHGTNQLVDRLYEKYNIEGANYIVSQPTFQGTNFSPGLRIVAFVTARQIIEVGFL